MPLVAGSRLPLEPWVRGPSDSTMTPEQGRNAAWKQRDGPIVMMECFEVYEFCGPVCRSRMWIGLDPEMRYLSITAGSPECCAMGHRALVTLITKRPDSPHRPTTGPTRIPAQPVDSLAGFHRGDVRAAGPTAQRSPETPWGVGWSAASGRLCHRSRAVSPALVGLSRYPTRTPSAASGHVYTRTPPAPTAWRPLTAVQWKV